MADARTWVKFTRDYEHHVGQDRRTFAAGKVCAVSPEIARRAAAASAAEPIADPTVRAARSAKKAPAKTPVKAAAAKTPAKRKR